MRTRALCCLPVWILGHRRRLRHLLREATRGYNAATALVHAAAQSCDCTAETEVPGLIHGTDLRPADILTSALDNSYTALDISMCSPGAQQAGSDCTQARLEAKLAHTGPHFTTLLRQNISYTPITWSAHGRRHRDTLTILRSLSESVARKRNFGYAEVAFQRLQTRIILEIWKRSARHIRACWPLTALPSTLDPDPQSLPGTRRTASLLWSPRLSCAAVLSFLARVGSDAHACVR